MLTHSCLSIYANLHVSGLSFSPLFQLPIFDKDVIEKAGEGGDADLSDSEESVFSGLEDSGSDIDDEEEDDGDDEEEEEEEDDDVGVILDENLKNSSGAETSAEPAEPKVNMGVFILRKLYSRVLSVS